jgi:type I restriction enzyme S subunit
MNNLSNQVLSGLVIPVPPIAVQKRVVTILDEAFEGIDTAIANTEKNLANARELFDSRLNSVVSDIWRSCDVVSMADLATSITDGDHLPPPKAPTGVPFITIGNINKDTREVDFTDTFMVDHGYFADLKNNRKPKRG